MQKLTRRNFLVAMMMVLVWLSFVVSGTHALLSDAATLSGNSLTVGSAGLLISNSQNPSSTIYDKTREGFAVQLAPGQSDEKYFLLKNTSTSDIPLVVDVVAQSEDIMSALASMTTVDIVPVDADGNQLPEATVSGGSLNGISSHHALLYGEIPKGGVQRYKVRTHVADAYDQSNQTLQYDLVFTGTQKVS